MGLSDVYICTCIFPTVPRVCLWSVIIAFPSHNIRIYHVCNGGIEKSVPRITDWHHEACRVMTNGDPEGRIFLSHPHTNNGFFFLAQH